MKSEEFTKIFNEAVADYHLNNNIDQPIQNPYTEGSLESLLYQKTWIDTVQWHLEDLIREPEINAEKALKIKRRIDKSNQERTDLVEKIDDYFLIEFAAVSEYESAILNTESPAWALDRLSILILKIYHMEEQVQRKDVDSDHIQKCQLKLDVLLEQLDDLMLSINQLIERILEGKVKMKVYRQMKMYNDPKLNPVLYGQKNS